MTFLTQSIIALCFITLGLQPLHAQSNQTDIVEQTLTDVCTVAGLGAGGAILGLSTLSFVDEPSDHLKNIVVGGAIGVIIGVGVVAWSQADRSKDNFVALDGTNSSDFPTSQRHVWHKENHTAFTTKVSTAQSASFNFSF